MVWLRLWLTVRHKEAKWLKSGSTKLFARNWNGRDDKGVATPRRTICNVQFAAERGEVGMRPSSAPRAARCRMLCCSELLRPPGIGVFRDSGPALAHALEPDAR